MLIVTTTMYLSRIRKQLLFLGVLWIAPMAIAQEIPQSDPVSTTPQAAYLQLTHSQSHERVQSGDLVYLNFSIENTSDRISRDISVQIAITEGTFIEAYSQKLGTYDESRGLWQLPQLQAKESATLSFSLLMNADQDIDFQAFIFNVGSISMENKASTIQGEIKWVEEDCLVVFNDFSQTEKGRKRGLYADCATEYPNNFLQVFDRWGALVYEKENYDNSWTGKRHPKFTKFGREELLEGTYYYVLSFPESDRAEKTGWIYISE